MTEHDQLETLRIDPISVFEGDLNGIPCRETSDPERLCRHPVVSVHMITYNHGPYIRAAIEGVLMQQADFEYELVIGEDCSTDDTREICFEYQRRFPERIRVLWSERNLRWVGGNVLRTALRCRGEYVAFCEGDDYWTDPRKLQKQVDALRRNPSVGVCFCGARILEDETGDVQPWDAEHRLPVGFIPGRQLFAWHSIGIDPGRPGPETFLMTATVMLRREPYFRALKDFDIFRWGLHISDTTQWLGVLASSDGYYLPDEVSVYRRTSSGAVRATGNNGTWFDAFLVRIYFAQRLSQADVLDWMRTKAFDNFRELVLSRLFQLPVMRACLQFSRIQRLPAPLCIFSGRRLLPKRIICRMTGFRRWGYDLYNELKSLLHREEGA